MFLGGDSRFSVVDHIPDYCTMLPPHPPSLDLPIEPNFHSILIIVLDRPTQLPGWVRHFVFGWVGRWVPPPPNTCHPPTQTPVEGRAAGGACVGCDCYYPDRVEQT